MSTKLFAVLCGVLLCGSLTQSYGQTPSDQDLKKKAMQLEKEKLELDKKALDLQRKELDLQRMRQELQVQESAQSLSINLSGDVLFDYDKAMLKPAAEESLKKVAVVLSQFPESKVTIEGYTDAKGGTAVNMQLSRERASAVRDWFVKNGGIVATYITATGRGEANPVAPNTNSDGTDNPTGRAQNRRVSITIEKPSAPKS